MKSNSPSSEAIDDLCRPAKKFYYNTIMKHEHKLELLKKMIVMEDNGKEKIPDLILIHVVCTQKKVIKNHHTTCN